MKKTAFLLALLMVSTMALGLGSCEKEGAKDYNIAFLRPGVTNKKDNNVYANTVRSYEEQYGGKVTLISAGYTEVTSKVSAQAAAGRPIEVIFTATGNYPHYVHKNLSQPLNEYVDLKAPYMNIEMMDSTFRYNGKYYMATAITNQHMWGIFYNKDMFGAEGLEDPGSLHKKNAWTTDKLLEYLKYFRSKGSDSYGLCGWDFRPLYTVNGATFLNVDKAGKTSLNFGDTKLVYGLEFYKQVFTTSNSLVVNVAGRYEDFTNQLYPMWMEREYSEGTIVKAIKAGKMNFEHGFVPLPYGPGNAHKKNVSYADGYSMGNQCRNPQAAGIFINMVLDALDKEDHTLISEYTPNVKAVVDDMRGAALAIDSIDGAISELIPGILSASVEKSPSVALEENKNVAQFACDESNKQTTVEQLAPFTPFSVLFDDASTGIFKQADESVTLGIASDGDAITNQSLKITSTSAYPNGYIILATAAAEDVKLVGYRDYTVTFKYKVLKPNADGKDGNILFAILGGDKDEFRGKPIEIHTSGDEVGQVKEATFNIQNVKTDATDLRLIIQGIFVNEIVIDDISVTEYVGIT